MQNDGGRAVHVARDRLLRLGEPVGRGDGSAPLGEQIGSMRRDELADAFLHDGAGIFTRHRQHALALDPGLDVGAAQNGVHRLLDEFRLALFDDQNRLLPGAEADELGVDQRIGDVEHVERDAACAEHVGEPEQFERAQRGVVHAALQDDADVAGVAVEELVEPVLLDEADRGRPALLDFFLLVQVARRRQHDAVGITHGVFERVFERESRARVVAGREAAVDMAGADAKLQHHRTVGRLRQLEALLDRAHDRGQVRARVEQPDLRFHREGMAALLHDRGALAIIFADDDERAAGDAARCQIGERVGGDIGAYRRLEGGGAAQRIIDRGRERGGGGGLVRARLEADAELAQHLVGVGEHVDQVRDRRALIAGDVRYAGLQQRLGDGENALAAELLSRAEPKLRDFTFERAFRHQCPLVRPLVRGPAIDSSPRRPDYI